MTIIKVRNVSNCPTHSALDELKTRQLLSTKKSLLAEAVLELSKKVDVLEEKIGDVSRYKI